MNVPRAPIAVDPIPQVNISDPLQPPPLAPIQRDRFNDNISSITGVN